MAQEGRRFDRIRLPIEARCRSYGSLSDSWQTIQVLDLSASGIRFECEAMVEEQSRIEIQVMLPVSQRWSVLLGIVVRCRPLPADICDIAVEFEQLDVTQGAQIDEMVRFLKKQPKPPSPEGT